MASARLDAVEIEVVKEFAELGIHAFTTTRHFGSFATVGDEPVGKVMGRWNRLREAVTSGEARFATASQVHGVDILEHTGAWTGWLRSEAADGHLAPAAGTSMGVTIADCVPVFLAHPNGASGMLHSGWRGTAAGILPRAIERFAAHGAAPSGLHVHLGPAICGSCYEVGPDVYQQVVGKSTEAPTPVDLRAILADQAEKLGVRHISTSRWCTLCHNERFYSHRAGDPGRQVAVMTAERKSSPA